MGGGGGWRFEANRERGVGLGARRRTPTARDRRGVAMTHLVMIFFFAAAGGGSVGVSSGVAGTTSPAPGEPPKAWAPSETGVVITPAGDRHEPAGDARPSARARGGVIIARAPDSEDAPAGCIFAPPRADHCQDEK